jgi:hypothetical protein
VEVKTNTGDSENNDDGYAQNFHSVKGLVKNVDIEQERVYQTDIEHCLNDSRALILCSNRVCLKTTGIQEASKNHPAKLLYTVVVEKSRMTVPIVSVLNQ